MNLWQCIKRLNLRFHVWHESHLVNGKKWHGFHLTFGVAPTYRKEP